MSDVPTNEVVTPAKRTIKIKKADVSTVPAKAKATKPKKVATASEGGGDCAICMEKFNKNTHTRVECQHCHQPTCRTCLQTYLVDAGMVPLCMMPECKMPWSEDFVETNTLTTWRLNALKKAREQFIYDIQRSRLPETQGAAEDYLAAKKFIERYHKEVVEPAEKELEKFPAHKGIKEIEVAIAEHDLVFTDRTLGTQTNYGCERYAEYQEWCKKKQELLSKWTNFTMVLNGYPPSPEVIAAEKRLLENSVKEKTLRLQMNRVFKKLLKANPSNVTHGTAYRDNADYKKLCDDYEAIRTLTETDRNYIHFNGGNDYKRALKEFNRIKAGYGRLVVDNIVVLDGGADMWRARRCIDSKGAQAFRRGGGAEKEVVEKRAFVRACPANDCRGFLSTAWKCGLCNVWVCPDCHDIKKEQKDDSHICDKGALETAKLLAKEAKPCPKCAAQISKIDGCDQMWCTQCHTSFSWRTGQEVKEGEWVHNPHYYEWMRRNGKAIPRTPGDPGGRAGVDPCGGFIQWTTLAVLDPMLARNARRPTAYGVRYIGYDNGIAAVLHEASQPNLSDERQQVIIREMAWRILEGFHQHAADMRWRYQRRPEILTNEDIYQTSRVEFLAGEMNEEELKVMLQRKDKARRKTKADWDIHNMYITAANDIFQMVATQAMDVFEAIVALEDLRLYTNDMLEANQKRFNNVFHKIAPPGSYLADTVKKWFEIYKKSATGDNGGSGDNEDARAERAILAFKKIMVPAAPEAEIRHQLGLGL